MGFGKFQDIVQDLTEGRSQRLQRRGSSLRCRRRLLHAILRSKTRQLKVMASHTLGRARAQDAHGCLAGFFLIRNLI